MNQEQCNARRYRVRLYDECGNYTTPQALRPGWDAAVEECRRYAACGLRACVVDFETPDQSSRILFDTEPQTAVAS